MLICYYVLFVNMFLRPFGSKRLRESYVFKNYSVFKKISPPHSEVRRARISFFNFIIF